MSPRRAEPDPLEQCPTCKIARGSYCVLARPLREDRKGQPAAEMHRPRIAMGQKWQDWHAGIPARPNSEDHQ